MAKICDLKDDLTGQLGSIGSGNGARTGSDQYMQAVSAGGMSSAMPSMNGASGFSGRGPVSPIPAQPPAQFAMASPPPQRQMPPPMDSAASVQAMQQRAAMESDIMRPPYSQPYGPAAYATQPGFQGAPVGALQVPTYASMDTCGSYGAAPRMTPAAQMQALQQQQMAQLQARQQALSMQASAAQAGQACLKGKTAKKLKGLSTVGAGDDMNKGLKSQTFWLLMLPIIIALLVLIIVGLVYAVKGYNQSRDVASALQSPIVGV